IAELSYRFMNDILAADPLRAFLDRDPEYALRVLTSKTSIIQSRMVAAVGEELAKQKAGGHINPSIDTDNLAYLMIRVMESFIYSDQIIGREPNVDIAREAVWILVADQP